MFSYFVPLSQPECPCRVLRIYCVTSGKYKNCSWWVKLFHVGFILNRSFSKKYSRWWKPFLLWPRGLPNTYPNTAIAETIRLNKSVNIRTLDMVVVHNREIKFHCKMSMIDLALTETACRRVSWTHKHLGSSPESRSSAEVWTRGNPLVLQRSAEKLRNSWAIIETCEKLQMNARLGQEMRRQNVVDSTANHSSYCAHRRALLWLPSWLAQQL